MANGVFHFVAEILVPLPCIQRLLTKKLLGFHVICKWLCIISCSGVLSRATSTSPDLLLLLLLQQTNSSQHSLNSGKATTNYKTAGHGVAVDIFQMRV